MPTNMIIGLLFLCFITPKALSCRNNVYGNGCCVSIIRGFFGTGCDVGSPWCDFFGGNCVVCDFVFDPSNGCELITKCSCYYCCEKEYSAYCPQGCDNCVEDGEGGCRENSDSKEKFLGCASAGTSSKAMGFATTLSKLKRKSEARMAFEKIDADKDQSISKEEAIHYVITLGQQNMSAEDLAKNSSWFDAIDRNGNQKIEPAEFDRSLA